MVDIVELDEKGNEKVDTHWYTDTEMNGLLKHLTNGRNDVDYISPIGRGWGARSLNAILTEYTAARVLMQEPKPTKLLIPFNSGMSQGGSHWVGIVVDFTESDKNNALRPSVFYVDPFGNPPAQDVLDLLATQYGIYPIVSRTVLQIDGHNCGPKTIQILSECSKKDAPLPNNRAELETRMETLKNKDGAEVRKEHAVILGTNQFKSHHNYSSYSSAMHDLGGDTKKDKSVFSKNVKSKHQEANLIKEQKETLTEDYLNKVEKQIEKDMKEFEEKHPAPRTPEQDRQKQILEDHKIALDLHRELNFNTTPKPR